MTTEQIIAYYADLLILQYLQMPKAYAHIKALIANVVMNQLPISVREAFSIDTAVGVQMETLGKYIGVSRYGLSFNGPVTLNDNDFRILIKLKIITNNSGSSMAEIKQLLFESFVDKIQVYDYKNMNMSYFIDLSLGSVELAQVMVLEGILPKPMGVGLSVIFAPAGNNFYGYRTYEYQNSNTSPMNSYSSYQMNRPWISYTNAL